MASLDILDTLKDPEELINALKSEVFPISLEGSRRSEGTEHLLMRLEKKVSLLGITRVAEVSQLITSQFPTFQCARPFLHTHTETGQNSGGQGKGWSKAQAKVSAIMETVEGFCMEPRNPWMIRASYNFLKKTHPVVNPESIRQIKGGKVTKSDPIMWTWGASLDHSCRVLIPAQCVFFPFFHKDYDTKGAFPNSTNGAAAGATYVEAIVQSLYEVIERHYHQMWEEGTVKARGVFEEDFSLYHKLEMKRRMPGYELQIFFLDWPRKKNFPTIMSLLVGEGKHYLGVGSDLDIDRAFSKSVAESLQAAAVIASGSREDMDSDESKENRGNILSRGRFPVYRTIKYKDIKKRIIKSNYKSLNDELSSIRSWINDENLGNVYVANLTRSGLDIPVVKTIVSKAKFLTDLNIESDWLSADVEKRKYSLI